MSRATTLNKKQMLEIKQLNEALSIALKDLKQVNPPIYQDLIKDCWFVIRKLHVSIEKNRIYRSPREQLVKA